MTRDKIEAIIAALLADLLVGSGRPVNLERLRDAVKRIVDDILGPRSGEKNSSENTPNP